MRRRLAVVAGIGAALLAVAPAAHAVAVPFNLHYYLGGQQLEAGTDYSADSDFVGFCGKDACQGFEITARVSNVGAETAPFQATLRGYACFLDSSSACSSTGVPFTGLQITDRVVDAPEGRTDLAVWDVSFCMWGGQWYPYWCTSPVPLEKLIYPADTGNLAEPAPTTVGA